MDTGPTDQGEEGYMETGALYDHADPDEADDF
jgi:hypothetical protein